MGDSSERNFIKEWSTIIAAFILGICIIVATVVVSNMVTYVKTFNESQLAVTGSASQDVTSTEVKWTGQYSVDTHLTDLKTGYAQMAQDKTMVTAFLQNNGIPSSDVTISPVMTQMTYPNAKWNPQDAKALGPGALSAYTLTQTVVIQSGDVNKITQLAQNVAPLISGGVNFTSQSLQYFYTKLPQIRGELQAKAIADAQTRAKEMAAAAGDKLGPLVSVSTGPLQLTPVNSTESGGAGSYDTTTIPKKLTTVVRASFKLSR